MSEPLNPPIESTTYDGMVNAIWINSQAIWTSDYFPNPNLEYEELQFERSHKRLHQEFKRYKLLEPTIELDPNELNLEINDRQEAAKIGAQVLRVTTLLMPYVDPQYLRPIMSIRQPAPTPEEVERSLVLRDLRNGGQAIHTVFGSAMTPRR